MSVIKYVGPFDEVEVEGLTCKRLQTIEVSPALAKSLRGQEDWQQPKSDSPAAKDAVKNPAPPVDPAVGLDDPDREPDPVAPPSNVTHADDATEHDVSAPDPEPATDKES